MAKMRIYELARELVESGLAKDSKSLNTDIINLLSENGIEGKSHSSGLEENEAELVRNHYKNKGEKKPQKEVKPEPKTETKVEPKVEEKTEPKAETKEESKTEVKADSKPEEKAAAPSVVRHPENSEKKGAPKQQRVPAGKLIGKDGKETPYWIAKDGRLVAMDGKALPLKMGPNGKIVKLDGSPLQKRPAPAPIRMASAVSISFLSLPTASSRVNVSPQKPPWNLRTASIPRLIVSRYPFGNSLKL